MYDRADSSGRTYCRSSCRPPAAAAPLDRCSSKSLERSHTDAHSRVPPCCTGPCLQTHHQEPQGKVHLHRHDSFTSGNLDKKVQLKAGVNITDLCRSSCPCWVWILCCSHRWRFQEHWCRFVHSHASPQRTGQWLKNTHTHTHNMKLLENTMCASDHCAPFQLQLYNDHR